MKVYYKEFLNDLQIKDVNEGPKLSEIVKEHCHCNPKYVEAFIHHDDKFHLIKQKHWSKVRPRKDVYLQALPLGLGPSSVEDEDYQRALSSSRRIYFQNALSGAVAGGLAGVKGGPFGIAIGAIVGIGLSVPVSNAQVNSDVVPQLRRDLKLKGNSFRRKLYLANAALRIPDVTSPESRTMERDLVRNAVAPGAPVPEIFGSLRVKPNALGPLRKVRERKLNELYRTYFYETSFSLGLGQLYAFDFDMGGLGDPRDFFDWGPTRYTLNEGIPRESTLNNLRQDLTLEETTQNLITPNSEGELPRSMAFDKAWTLNFDDRVDVSNITIDLALSLEPDIENRGSASSWKDFYYPRESGFYITRDEAEEAAATLAETYSASLISVEEDNNLFYIRRGQGVPIYEVKVTGRELINAGTHDLPIKSQVLRQLNTITVNGTLNPSLDERFTFSLTEGESNTRDNWYVYGNRLVYHSSRTDRNAIRFYDVDNLPDLDFEQRFFPNEVDDLPWIADRSRRSGDLRLDDSGSLEIDRQTGFIIGNNYYFEPNDEGQDEYDAEGRTRPDFVKYNLITQTLDANYVGTFGGEHNYGFAITPGNANGFVADGNTIFKYNLSNINSGNIPAPTQFTVDYTLVIDTFKNTDTFAVEDEFNGYIDGNIFRFPVKRSSILDDESVRTDWYLCGFNITTNQLLPDETYFIRTASNRDNLRFIRKVSNSVIVYYTNSSRQRSNDNLIFTGVGVTLSGTREVVVRENPQITVSGVTFTDPEAYGFKNIATVEAPHHQSDVRGLSNFILYFDPTEKEYELELSINTVDGFLDTPTGRYMAGRENDIRLVFNGTPIIINQDSADKVNVQIENDRISIFVFHSGNIPVMFEALATVFTRLPQGIRTEPIEWDLRILNRSVLIFNEDDQDEYGINITNPTEIDVNQQVSYTYLSLEALERAVGSRSGLIPLSLRLNTSAFSTGNSITDLTIRRVFADGIQKLKSGDARIITYPSIFRFNNGVGIAPFDTEAVLRFRQEIDVPQPPKPPNPNDYPPFPREPTVRYQVIDLQGEEIEVPTADSIQNLEIYTYNVNVWSDNVQFIQEGFNDHVADYQKIIQEFNEDFTEFTSSYSDFTLDVERSFPDPLGDPLDVDYIYTENPATICLHILNVYLQRSDLDLELSEFVDLASFNEWANFCETYFLSFNGSFDFDTTVFKAIETIASVGRARVVNDEGKLRVIFMQQKSVPTQYFHSKNILSFTTTFTKKQPPHAISFEFQNFARRYKQDQLVLYYDGHTEETAKDIQTLDGFGIVFPDQATEQALLYYNALNSDEEGLDLVVSIEALVSKIGDLVGVNLEELEKSQFTATYDKPYLSDNGNAVLGVFMTEDTVIDLESGKDYGITILKTNGQLLGPYSVTDIAKRQPTTQNELLTREHDNIQTRGGDDLFHRGEFQYAFLFENEINVINFNNLNIEQNDVIMFGEITSTTKTYFIGSTQLNDDLSVSIGLIPNQDGIFLA